MIELLPIALAAGFLALGAAAAAWAVQAERKRSQALGQAAARMGLEPLVWEPSQRGLYGLQVFDQGHNRRTYNVFRRLFSETEEAYLFDYDYTTGSGKSRHTHRQTLAAFRRSGRALPRFELRPENVLHKIGGLFGYQDIDFEGFPEFSRNYLLRGQDEAAVRALWRPFLLQHLGLHPGWCLEGGGDWLVAYRDGRRVEAEKLQEFFEDSRALHALL
ncbi:MAG TPA: hypothetical protein DCM05_17505 [Elusimicrobia bacterium]|nr:hypothetical protein [Elusimicrobiota bacterium]